MGGILSSNNSVKPELATINYEKKKSSFKRNPIYNFLENKRRDRIERLRLKKINIYRQMVRENRRKYLEYLEMKYNKESTYTRDYFYDNIYEIIKNSELKERKRIPIFSKEYL